MPKLKITALWLAVLSIVIFTASSSYAAMVGTSELLTESNRTQLQEQLKRKDVQAQLIEMGVNPEEAIARVDNMTDEEILEVYGQLETLPAGARLSTVELLLIIIIIILLI